MQIFFKLKWWRFTWSYFDDMVILLFGLCGGPKLALSNEKSRQAHSKQTENFTLTFL